jgi:hypothetical protein
VYNLNRLEWHLGDERQKRFITPQGTVWSCRVVSDWDFSLLTNRFAAALAKSQDHRASCGVFAFGVDRQGAIANGLHGLNPRNTAHRYTPVQNVTSVGLATGKSQVHGGTRLVDKVNKLVKRTWGLFVMNIKSGVGRIPCYPPLVELCLKGMKDV